MLVVTVELVPGGDYSHAREIASMEIVNISDLAALSDYMVRVQENGAAHLGVSKTEQVLEIKDHKRNQSVWALIGKIIEKMKS